MSTESAAPREQWWGKYPLETDTGARWVLGPLRLGAQRLPGEVRISWRSAGGPEKAEIVSGSPCAESPHEEGAELTRFALEETEVAVTLRPILPDRAVVARPDTTLWVLGRQRVDLFVSVPLWAELYLPGGPAPVLTVPSLRLSDTWFGPSPQEGELCYSSRTQARLDVAKLPQHPVRAVTRVTINNQRPTAIRVERIKLPTPLLGLYATPEHRFWTSSVELRPANTDSAASIHLRAPEGLADDRFELISPPRRQQHANMFERALSALVG